MKLTRNGWLRAGMRVVLGVVLAGLPMAGGQSLTTTTVQGTVYLANGQAASGTLTVSWPAFTTAAGQLVAADSTTVTIPSDGFVSVNLAPNQGATPAGEYYTAVFYLSDGSVNTQYWVVPAAAQATLAQVQAQVMPAAQAVQAVSKAYVDQAVTEASGNQLAVAGGTLTGALYLNGDPTQPTQAADMHYVQDEFALAVPLTGGDVTGALTAKQLGAAYQVDQFTGADFGAQLQACLAGLSTTYGGTCDARNFTGTLAMGENVTVTTGNTTIELPCATIATANQIIVTAGTRNVALKGCALRGGSTANGNLGGTVLEYSGAAGAVQVGDPTYAADTMGFHMDNVAISTTGATSAAAQGFVAYRTQELDLESLYFLGNQNQTAMTLDGTGNYTGGTFFDDAFNGFGTAVNAVGHKIANPATTDWMNASTFVRVHIDCPTSNGSPIAGTVGINLVQGDGNTFTGGDVEGCSTAMHLGANAQNNTIVGLRNENSTSQVVADAGSSYNNWMTGGTMFTGALTDNGTRNSFLDTFHRSFNGLNGDWYGSQQDATVTNHYRLGIGTGNERGLLNEIQTDYGYRWIDGYTDATAGEQYYEVQDLLNNVNRLSIGQYNNGQSSTNNQTAVNAAGTGAVVLNGSNNAGTGGVVIGSGGASETTVATISNAGNAQFNGTLQVGGASTFIATPTVKNQADAEIDATLWAGLTTSQKESFIYKDWNGNSQWYMVKDASNNWALNSAVGGLDSFKAYQSTNSGDTYIDASNSSGAVRVNYETGSGTAFNIYGGGSGTLYASFTATNAIKFPGLAAASGYNCLQIDNSGYITNTGSACGSGGSGGSGTVASANAGQIAYYPASGTSIGGMSSVPVTAGGTGSTTTAGALQNLGALAYPGATGIPFGLSAGSSRQATAADMTALLGYAPLNPANNLGDVAAPATALQNLGGQAALGYTPLKPANNLSDVASPAAARANLGAVALAGATFTGAINAPAIEGVLQADQQQSPAGTGNNGIAQSLTQCAALSPKACTVVAPAQYAQTEAQPWGGVNTPIATNEHTVGPKATDPFVCVTDWRYAVPQVQCNSGSPNPSAPTRFLSTAPTYQQNIDAVGQANSPLTAPALSAQWFNLGGAANSNIIGSFDHDGNETGMGALNVLDIDNGEGSNSAVSIQEFKYGLGDTIAVYNSQTSVGQGLAQNEGLEWRTDLDETGNVTDATLNSVTCGATCTFSLTQTNGTPGAWGNGVALIDLTKGYSTGYVSQISNGTFTGSGTSWSSTYGATTGTALTTAAISDGGNANTFPRTGVAISVGSVSGTFTTGQVLCMFDSVDPSWQCANITAASISGSSGTITVDRMNWPLSSGSTVAAGGLSGYGFGMDEDWDSQYSTNGFGGSDFAPNGTIRQILPIVSNSYTGSVDTLTVFDPGGVNGQIQTRAYTAQAGSGGSATVTVSGGAATACTATGGSGYSTTEPPVLQITGITSTTPPSIYATVTGGSLSGCTVQTGGAGIAGTASVVVSPNPYHIYPEARTFTVYNAATGALDGSALVTTPTAGTFSTGDAVEQPHYFRMKIPGWNQQVVNWQQPGQVGGMGVTHSGYFAGNDYEEYFNNDNSPNVYANYPLASTPYLPGQNQLTTPYGFTLVGPHRNGLFMQLPPFSNQGTTGAVVVSVGSYANAQNWTAPIPMMTVNDGSQATEGEDQITYTPSKGTWQINSGANGNNSAGALAQLALSPSGFTVSGAGLPFQVGSSGNVLSATTVAANNTAMGNFENDLSYSQFPSGSIGTAWQAYCGTAGATVVSNTTDLVDPVTGGYTVEKYTAPTLGGSGCSTAAGQAQYTTLTASVAKTACFWMRGHAGGEKVYSLIVDAGSAAYTLSNTAWTNVCAGGPATVSGSEPTGWYTTTSNATIYVADALQNTGSVKGPDVVTSASAQSIAQGFCSAGSCAALSAFVPLNSPAFTGTPTVPTASPGTDTTQIATTAFVQAAVGSGGGSGTVVASPQYSMFYQPNSGSSTTAQGDPNATTNGSGDVQVKAMAVGVPSNYCASNPCVHIAPLSTATNWNFDTTTAATALASLGGAPANLSGTVAITANSTALTCTTGTATVTGATTNMVATASAAGTHDPDVTAPDAWVSASGTVTVQICTLISDASAPSITYNIRVLQ